MREKAIDEINRERPPRRPSVGDPTPTSTAGDHFHNGREVLPDVTSWHGVLRSALRETDTLTSRVLDMVDQKMLLGDSRKRSKAKDICVELKQILNQVQAQPRRQIPESIMKALLEVDEEAPSKGARLIPSNTSTSAGKSLGVPQDRKARKSKLLDLPLMKTTHRSEYLKSALSVQSIEPEVRQALHESPTKEEGPVQLPASRVPDPRSFSQGPPGEHNHSNDEQAPGDGGVGTIYSAASISSLPNRPSLPRRSRTSISQDVFQAREEVERREKGNFLRATRKDKLLTRHFSNRDIVSS
jgi:hypothetical protein